MADFLTHDMLGLEVIRTARPELKARLEEFPEAFRWGCQGPDPLFYRRLWEGGGPWHPLAGRMHSEDTAGLFQAMASYVTGMKGWAREACAAYLDGFLCHYALDSAIHPYVYFLQKRIEKEHPQLHRGTVHCQIETDIDIALYAARGGRQIWDYAPEDGHQLPAMQKAQLARMLSRTVEKVYGRSLPEYEAAAAFDDTLFFEKLLYRQGHRLGRIAFAAGLLHPGWSEFISHVKVSRPEWDCLNLRRRGWRNPDFPAELHCESVPELLEAARQATLFLADEFENMFRSGHVTPVDFPVGFDNGNAL